MLVSPKCIRTILETGITQRSKFMSCSIRIGYLTYTENHWFSLASKNRYKLTVKSKIEIDIC